MAFKALYLPQGPLPEPGNKIVKNYSRSRHSVKQIVNRLVLGHLPLRSICGSARNQPVRLG
jgi:hypothetical protein